MVRTVRYVASIGSLALALSTLSACSERHDANPAAPTAPEPLPTFTLSGVISVSTPNGTERVEGAVVEDTQTHKRTTTDAGGAYRLPGLDTTVHTIAVSRYGLVTEMRTLTISGDTQLDVQFAAPFSLSGRVFELTPTGQAPIDGVELYCDACGPEGHTLAHTAADGSYKFDWVPTGTHLVLVRKKGFFVPAAQILGGLEGRDVTVKGDTRFDIELARR